MDDEEALRQQWRTLVELGEAVPDSGLAWLGESLQKTGPWPEDLADSPMILDTDIGGDVDDAIAVTVAARTVPGLAVVITGDEVSGRRARFARHLLDELGRTDVVTVAGADLGNSRYWVVDDLIPSHVSEQRTDVVNAVREVCADTSGPVRWVGMAPLSNLARVAKDDPRLASRLHVTQMGGALSYRNPNRGEHNIRLDVPAARVVLDAVGTGVLSRVEFVASEVTFNSSIEVSRNHPIYRALAVEPVSTWAGLLRQHLDLWFDRFHPSSIQHDALALSAALGLPFVDSETVGIVMDEIGRTTISHDGVEVHWSRSAAYGPFMAWLTNTVAPNRIAP